MAIIHLINRDVVANMYYNGAQIDFSLINKITYFDYAIMPLIVILVTVIIIRKNFGTANITVFKYSLIPGAFFSIDFGYGFFKMGHGEGLFSFLLFAVTWGLQVYLVAPFLSGIIGMSMNFFWNKWITGKSLY